jgi:hypothetical protein
VREEGRRQGGDERGGGSQAGLVGLAQRHGELGEAALGLALVGVVVIVGEDDEAGGPDGRWGVEPRRLAVDVGEGVAQGGLDERVGV